MNWTQCWKVHLSCHHLHSRDSACHTLVVPRVCRNISNCYYRVRVLHGNSNGKPAGTGTLTVSCGVAEWENFYGNTMVPGSNLTGISTAVLNNFMMFVATTQLCCPELLSISSTSTSSERSFWTAGCVIEDHRC